MLFPRRLVLVVCLLAIGVIASAQVIRIPRIVRTRPSPAQAACTTTTSTHSRTDVANAVSAAASGDVICVPAGDGAETWATPITVTKAMEIRGPGKASLSINGSFSYEPTAAEAVKTFELSGFTFDRNGGATAFEATNPGSTPITGLKIHDNEFREASPRAVVLHGLEFGVFYNNLYRQNNISVSVISAGDGGWNYNHDFGSANYPYFEDETFDAVRSTDAFVFETGQGGRIAFRHNTVVAVGTSCTGAFCELFDIHGNQGDRGTVSSEVYHNTVDGGAGSDRWIHHRGGQAIIANNDVTPAMVFEFTEYQAWNGNGICDPYPAQDQINNSFYFNNRSNGSQQDPTFTSEGASCDADPPPEADDYIILNREYWLPTEGLAANLPATCTDDDDTFYGATDTDQIWECTGTNQWTLFFTPYTYPHPLR